MRAIVYDRFGGPEVLCEREVPDPVAGRGELLVRVRAAALNPKDNFVRAGRFRWITGRGFPRPFGHDLAGEVVALGPGVRGFALGERVYGCYNNPRARPGSLAQLAAIPASACAPAPPGLDLEAAASVPLAAQTALQALRDVARVRAGDRVLLNGASGGVGVYAIQIARALGAHVTTTSGPSNLERCLALGAHEALLYAGDPALAPPRRYRVVLDIYGNRSLARARPVLEREGVYVTTVPSPRILRDAARTLFARPRARLVVIRPRRADLETLAGWLAQGTLRPVVDRVYDWDAVRDAVAYLEGKHARGKVVVRVP